MFRVRRKNYPEIYDVYEVIRGTDISFLLYNPKNQEWTIEIANNFIPAI